MKDSFLEIAFNILMTLAVVLLLAFALDKGFELEERNATIIKKTEHQKQWENCFDLDTNPSGWCDQEYIKRVRY